MIRIGRYQLLESVPNNKKAWNSYEIIIINEDMLEKFIMKNHEKLNIESVNRMTKTLKPGSDPSEIKSNEGIYKFSTLPTKRELFNVIIKGKIWITRLTDEASFVPTFDSDTKIELSVMRLNSAIAGKLGKALASKEENENSKDEVDNKRVNFHKDTKPTTEETFIKSRLDDKVKIDEREFDLSKIERDGRGQVFHRIVNGETTYLELVGEQFNINYKFRCFTPPDNWEGTFNACGVAAFQYIVGMESPDQFYEYVCKNGLARTKKIIDKRKELCEIEMCQIAEDLNLNLNLVMHMEGEKKTLTSRMYVNNNTNVFYQIMNLSQKHWEISITYDIKEKLKRNPMTIKNVTMSDHGTIFIDDEDLMTFMKNIGRYQQFRDISELVADGKMQEARNIIYQKEKEAEEAAILEKILKLSKIEEENKIKNENINKKIEEETLKSENNDTISESELEEIQIIKIGDLRKIVEQPDVFENIIDYLFITPLSLNALTNYLQMTVFSIKSFNGGTKSTFRLQLDWSDLNKKKLMYNPRSQVGIKGLSKKELEDVIFN
jgi:hypothetical protein